MIFFLVILLISGVLLLVSGIKLSKRISIIGTILVIGGFIGELIAVITWVVHVHAPMFEIESNGFIGIGPGVYLAIAALILGIFSLISFKKETA